MSVIVLLAELAQIGFSLTTLYIFRIYCSGSNGPVLLLLHGGGHSALSWAVFTVSISFQNLYFQFYLTSYTNIRGGFNDMFRYNLKFSCLDLCSLSYTAGSTAGWCLWTFELMVNTVYKLLFIYWWRNCYFAALLLCPNYGHSTKMMKWSPRITPLLTNSSDIMCSCSLTTSCGCSAFVCETVNFFFFYHLQVTPEWKILMISQRTQWPSKLIDRRLIKTDHILSLSICQNNFSTCWGNLGLSQLSFVFFKKGYW